MRLINDKYILPRKSVLALLTICSREFTMFNTGNFNAHLSFGKKTVIISDSVAAEYSCSFLAAKHTIDLFLIRNLSHNITVQHCTYTEDKNKLVVRFHYE